MNLKTCPRNSIGIGKIIVEFFSAAIPVSVCKYRSCSAAKTVCLKTPPGGTVFLTWWTCNGVSSFFQILSSIHFTLSSDDLGLGFTWGFRFSCHCSLKTLRKSDIFDFNSLDSDTLTIIRYDSYRMTQTEKNLNLPHGSVAWSRICKSSPPICSLSDKTPESVRVPKMFLNVVWQKD